MIPAEITPAARLALALCRLRPIIVLWFHWDVCRALTRVFQPELIEGCQYPPQLAPNWPERLRRVESYGTQYYLLKTNGPHGLLWEAIRAHVSNPLYCDNSVVLLRKDQVAAGRRVRS